MPCLCIAGKFDFGPRTGKAGRCCGPWRGFVCSPKRADHDLPSRAGRHAWQSDPATCRLRGTSCTGFLALRDACISFVSISAITLASDMAAFRSGSHLVGDPRYPRPSHTSFLVLNSNSPCQFAKALALRSAESIHSGSKALTAAWPPEFVSPELLPAKSNSLCQCPLRSECGRFCTSHDMDRDFCAETVRERQRKFRESRD